ncbi:hypothetical protein J7M28_00030, partial [bacterium]|nr:hypothetical protein [bacterium]
SLALSEVEFAAAREFVAYLRSGQYAGDEIQTRVFDLARENELPQARMFRVLYGLILGQKQGPRLGHFIPILGQEKTAEKIEHSLESAGKVDE